MCPGIRSLATILLLTIVAAPLLRAGEWPEDYVVQENSKSPDGRFAVLVESQEAATNENTDEVKVYLADVKNHTTLGEIEKADYFEHQNHRGLAVSWAPDSSYCVVENDGRYGMDTLWALDIKDSKFVQIEIGERIQRALDAVMAKQSREKEMSGYVSPHFRLANDGKIRIRATSENNPKQLEDVKTYYALFQGTYDLAAKKWTVTDARSITSEQDEVLDAAYDDSFAKHIIVATEDKQVPESFSGEVFRSEDDKFDALDKRLNEVYQAVRSLLLPNRFAKVKQEQVAWVKTRDAAKSVEEKSKITEVRIEALQDLLW
jgi:hypothetical protein